MRRNFPWRRPNHWFGRSLITAAVAERQRPHPLLVLASTTCKYRGEREDKQLRDMTGRIGKGDEAIFGWLVRGKGMEKPWSSHRFTERDAIFICGKETDEYELQSWLDWNMDLKRSKRTACWTSSNKRAREETDRGRKRVSAWDFFYFTWDFF